MKAITTVKEVLEEAEKVFSSIDMEEEDGLSHSPGSLFKSTSGTTATTKTDKPTTSVDVPATNQIKKSSKRAGWKKPADKPKRPLSGYNLFFSLSRERILNCEPLKEYYDPQVVVTELSKLRGDSGRTKRRHRKSHGKISFTNLARIISKHWKDLPQESKIAFERVASLERERYKLELKAWQQKKAKSSDVADHSEPKDDDVTEEEDEVLDMSDREVPQESPSWNPPNSMSQDCHLPMIGANPDSLTALMSRGRAYQHYQAILEQKHAELQIRQSMLDHMRMMINYTTDGLSNGSPSGTMMNFPNYSPVNDAGYYDMADATLEMAQRTLPPPQQSLLMQTPSLDRYHPTRPTVLRLDPFVQGPIVPTFMSDHHPHQASNTTFSTHTSVDIKNPTFICDSVTTSPMTHSEIYEPITNSTTITPGTSSAMFSAELTSLDSMKPQLQPPEDGPIPFDFDDGAFTTESTYYEPICFIDDFA